jgi:hypothetical protein
MMAIMLLFGILTVIVIIGLAILVVGGGVYGLSKLGGGPGRSIERPPAAQADSACPSCGQAVQPGWTHCPHCGAPVA